MNLQEEITLIQKAMRKTNNIGLYERYLAIRLHLEGRSVTVIADILGRTYQTISIY